MSANQLNDVSATKENMLHASRAVDDQLNAEMVREAAAYVRARLPPDLAPVVAVVCGIGFSSIAQSLTDSVRLAFVDIPHFPTSTIEGHEGARLFVERGLASHGPHMFQYTKYLSTSTLAFFVLLAGLVAT